MVMFVWSMIILYAVAVIMIIVNWDKWIGEVQDDDTMKWLMKTYGCHTKYGAKRELRKWYKREVAPEKIEEIDPADLVGGELIDIFVLHNLMFLLFSCYIIQVLLCEN